MILLTVRDKLPAALKRSAIRGGGARPALQVLATEVDCLTGSMRERRSHLQLRAWTAAVWAGVTGGVAARAGGQRDLYGPVARGFS